MNRRAFLAALGAVATQQKLGNLTHRLTGDPADEPRTITTWRFPYVQNVQSDRATIMWATIEPGFGAVAYSSDGVSFNYAAAKSRFFSTTETKDSSNIYQYQAELTGLKPGTDYSYSVTVDGLDVNTIGATTFRTEGAGPFNFLVIGDSGWFGNTTGQSQVSERLLKEKASFLIHTGDLVYPRGEYVYYQRNYFNFYSGMMSSVPFFPCPGNHDYDLVNGTPYLAIHSVPTETVPAADRGRYYSFDWGNVHLVSIDAHFALDKAVNAGGPMLKWLDNDLKTSRQFFKVVYFHYPPWATGQNTGDKESRWVRDFMTSILENNNVQVVFSGHEHSYQRSVPMRKSRIVTADLGVTYMTSGGGGADLYGVPAVGTVAFARSNYHYLRVEVRDMQMTLRSIRQDGVEMDNYAVKPSPAFSDDARVTPITLNPGPQAGATIRIVGRNLAAEETFLCTPVAPTEMAGTIVTINGQRIQLLYVSPTQIYGQIPFALQGNITVQVTTPNNFAERSV